MKRFRRAWVWSASLGAIAGILWLYYWGAKCAYNVSLVLNASRDWAIVHSPYSWAYVVWSFLLWVEKNWNEPIGVIIETFKMMMTGA